MYFYVYDTFLQHQKFAKVLAKIESTCTDLGIQGQRVRLTLLKNISSTVKEALARGAKTIVVVGDDHTLSQVVNAVIDADITVGFIPVGDQNQLIAKVLQIPAAELAIDILAKRLTQTLRLGQINQKYFITQITLEKNKVQIIGDNQFQLQALSNYSEIAVCNFNHFNIKTPAKSKLFNPQDDKLELVVTDGYRPNFLSRFSSKKNKTLNFNEQTIIPLKNIYITHFVNKAAISVSVDGQKLLRTPVKISISNKTIKLIVGRGHDFQPLKQLSPASPAPKINNSLMMV